MDLVAQGRLAGPHQGLQQSLEVLSVGGACSFRITRSTASCFIRQYSCARSSCRTMPRSSGSSIRTRTIGRSPEIPWAHSAGGPQFVAAARSLTAAATGPSRGCGWPGAGRGWPRRARSRGGVVGPAPASTPGSRHAQTSPNRCTCRPGRAPPRATGRRASRRRARCRAGGEPDAAPEAEDRVEHRADRVGEWLAVDDRHRRSDRRPRPRNRARSVSYWRTPTVSSSTAATCAAQTGSSSLDLAGASPAGHRARARTPSARTGWKSRVGRIGRRRRQDDLGV